MADIVSPRESRDTYCSSFEHFARSLYVFLYVRLSADIFLWAL